MDTPTHGARHRFVVHDSTQPVIDLTDKKRVQERMLPAICTLATQQSTPTIATMDTLSTQY